MEKIYKIAISVVVLGLMTAGTTIALQRIGGPEGDGMPHLGKDLRRRAPIKMEKVSIPRGCFDMGSYRGEEDEQPVYKECFKDFYIDKTEVTVAQYQRCVDAGVCSSALLDQSDWGSDEACNWGKPGREDHPINCVDWSQAKQYCQWVGGRLPTEREWEYAARGEGGWEYPWGDAEADCDHAVMHDGEDGCGAYSTMPVGSKPAGASPFGVLDMAGN
ncbi:MAG: protein kinase, partial [Deltaproteobacteria bacterium]